MINPTRSDGDGDDSPSRCQSPPNNHNHNDMAATNRTPVPPPLPPPPPPPVRMVRNIALFVNRDVQRAGWLKYIPFAERYSASDDHKFWVVFAIYDSTTPYLEFYQRRMQQNAIGTVDGPVSKHSLLNCRHIVSVIEPNRDHRHNEFVITLETYAIRLAADTDEVMYDWIGCLKTTLIGMQILPAAENPYSRSPESFGGRRLLPPPPPTTELDHTQPPADDNSELYEPIFQVTNQIQRMTVNGSMLPPAGEGPPPYDRIFVANATGTGGENPRPSFRESQVEKFKCEMQQLNGLTLKVRKRDCYNAIAFVDILPYGIFIAGWKQKNHPHLHNTFHVGDQLVNINGTVPESASHAKEFIKQSSPSLDFTIRRVPFGQIFCLKKSSEAPTEELGFVREKGTAQINHIIAGSVAARAGIPVRCTFYDDHNNGDDRSDRWFITEINNRPLNLMYKNNEVDQRLKAIGKEISILLQPYGFVKRLKKQLKTFKNYKDYVVQ